MVDETWKTAFKHREIISQSQSCGCFYCGLIFTPKDIVEWVDSETTALCPRCGMDAVLGDACDAYITSDFLYQMHKRWVNPRLSKKKWDESAKGLVVVVKALGDACEGFNCQKNSEIKLSVVETDILLCRDCAKQMSQTTLDLLRN